MLKPITGFRVILWTLFVMLIDVYLCPLWTHSGACVCDTAVILLRYLSKLSELYCIYLYISLDYPFGLLYIFFHPV